MFTNAKIRRMSKRRQKKAVYKKIHAYLCQQLSCFIGRRIDDSVKSEIHQKIIDSFSIPPAIIYIDLSNMNVGN